MVVVLYDESLRHPDSVDNLETQQIIATARMYGCYTHLLPAATGYIVAAEDALADLPKFERMQMGIWAGFIPSQAKYEAVYRAARAHNIYLINDPIEHQTVMEFDRYYPLLGDLTPASIVVNSTAECEEIEAKLRFPVFVRGAVKSNKTLGWDACVANDIDELKYIVEQILSIPHRSRGRAIIRQLVKLKSRSMMPGNFPRTREYRLFVYRDSRAGRLSQRVLAYGYYWDEFADEFELTETDRSSLQELAISVADRVRVPYLIVDVGQLDSGDWIVIEIGDAQFAGMSHISISELWSQLARLDL